MHQSSVLVGLFSCFSEFGDGVPKACLLFTSYKLMTGDNPRPGVLTQVNSYR